jgi:hypothetical protein
MSVLTTREREALAVLSRDEWLSAHTIGKLADMPSAHNALVRLLARGLVEINASTWPRLWRRTGGEVRFNDGGTAWSVPCSAFDPGDELQPIAEDTCGNCGRRFDEHAVAGKVA